MRNSYERLKSIQTSLTELSNSLEEQYCEMYQECRDEIINDRREYETKKNEMYALSGNIEGIEELRKTIKEAKEKYKNELSNVDFLIGGNFNG